MTNIDNIKQPVPTAIDTSRHINQEKRVSRLDANIIPQKRNKLNTKIEKSGRNNYSPSVRYHL